MRYAIRHSDGRVTVGTVEERAARLSRRTGQLLYALLDVVDRNISPGQTGIISGRASSHDAWITIRTDAGETTRYEII